MSRLYAAIWHWQLYHTTPRWIDINTGECVSHIGRIMSGRWIDREHTMQYVWVSLKKYRAWCM